MIELVVVSSSSGVDAAFGIAVGCAANQETEKGKRT